MSRWLISLPFLIFTSSVAALDRYTARFDENLSAIEVEACFAGQAPKQLYRSSEAADYASAPTLDGQPLKSRARGDTLYLPDLPVDSCIEWRVRIGHAASAGDYRTAFRVGDTVVAATGLWFWKGPWQRTVNVTVELPDGFSFSAPWPMTGVGGKALYTPAKTPASWSSRTAVGRFEMRHLEVPGATVHLALTGEPDAGQKDKLTRWIKSSVDAVVPVFGYFPRAQVQVLVVPIGKRNEPVPWAHVMRGGGPAVEFFVDENRPLAEFDGDWTSTHEFSHLLLPYVSSHDRWLSEGLASYYQNVLRARNGRLSEIEAWQKLHEGFERGERGTRNETLKVATRSGHDSIMRIYWSGAAMMLEADTRLRELTEGRQSLDTVLRDLNTCCRRDGKRWSAWDLLSELDRLSATKVFTRVYREHVHSESFPDVSDIYRDLGLESRFGRIRQVNDAPLEDIRDDIMAPGPG